MLRPASRVPSAAIAETLALVDLPAELQERALEKGLALLRALRTEPQAAQRLALFQFFLGFAVGDAQLALVLAAGAESIVPGRSVAACEPEEEGAGSWGS